MAKKKAKSSFTRQQREQMRMNELEQRRNQEFIQRQKAKENESIDSKVSEASDGVELKPEVEERIVGGVPQLSRELRVETDGFPSADEKRRKIEEKIYGMRPEIVKLYEASRDWQPVSDDLRQELMKPEVSYDEVYQAIKNGLEVSSLRYHLKER